MNKKNVTADGTVIQYFNSNELLQLWILPFSSAAEEGILFDLPVYILITKQSINKEYLSIVDIVDIYFKLYYIRFYS